MTRKFGSGTTTADWILRDAVIWTGESSQGPGSRPTAMALEGGRILALGTPDELKPLKGPDTAVRSLEGRFVMPGFIDAHVHLLAGGLQLFRVDLRGARSPEEFVQRVADRTRATPAGSWILGGDWNEEDWGGPLPHHQWLDRAAPEHPVFLHRADLHMGVANSLALDLAGIDRDTPHPEHGHIDRDPDTSEPTGILREHAILAISKAVPPPTEGQRRAALRAASLHALSLGVTQVHDMGALHSHEESWRSFSVLRTLRAEGRLPLRVRVSLPLDDWSRVADTVESDGHGDLRLGWGAVKAFVDGSLGSTTAWFHDPYLGRPSSAGNPIVDLEDLRRDLHLATRAGLQPAVHAIGDRAVDWILDVFEELDGANPSRDPRCRVEHGQHMTPEAIRRAGAAGRIVSVQPLHLVDDAVWVERKLGPARALGSFAFDGLERAGARMAYGSDWTVAPIDPIGAVQAAMTRRPRSRGGIAAEPWTPEQRVGLETALRAHTYGGAFAGKMEDDTGTLAAGKRGDFVVLSRDPFGTAPDDLRDAVHVDLTFVDGAVAYQRDDPAAAVS